jgi:hypothetical protein
MSLSCNLGSAPPAPVLTKRAYSTQRIFLLLLRGRGKLLTVAFKAVFLGAADATGETNLAAHRRSNFL